MNNAYFPIFMLFFILYLSTQDKRRKMQRLIITKRKENKEKMFEAAKKFIGKRCVVYTFDSNCISGTVKEVTNGAILLEKKGNEEIINLDFVMRIKESPEKK